MTTPTERTRAVLELAKAVTALTPYAYGLSPTVRIPRHELRVLIGWLRHYPDASDIEYCAKVAPELFAAPKDQKESK